MSDLERELRAMLDDSAGRVESDLTGPELRRRAAARAASRTGRVRRAVPVLASAAAVAALGVGAALLTTSADDPRPVQPGAPRPVTSAPEISSPPPTPPPTPIPTPTVSARPVPPRSSDSLAQILRSHAAVPTRGGSFPLRSLLIDPPTRPTSAPTSPSTSPPTSPPTSAPRS